MNVSLDVFLDTLGIDSSLVDTVIGLNDIELKDLEKCYTFNGIGATSETLHMGHYNLYNLLNRIVKTKGFPLMFQLATDQKRFRKGSCITLGHARTLEDALLESLRCVDWDRNVHFFSNIDPRNALVLRNCADYINAKIKISSALSVFGNVDVHSCFMIGMQLAPLVIFSKIIFVDYLPLILIESSEEGYFLLVRDICGTLGIKKPVIVRIHSFKDIHLTSKMSTSEPKKTIMLSEKGLDALKNGVSGVDHLTDYLLYLQKNLLNTLEDSKKGAVHRLMQDYLKEINQSSKHKQLFISHFTKHLLQKHEPIPKRSIYQILQIYDSKFTINRDLLDSTEENNERICMSIDSLERNYLN